MEFPVIFIRMLTVNSETGWLVLERRKKNRVRPSKSKEICIMYIYVGDELLGLKNYSFNENIAANLTPKVELNRKLFTNIV